MSDRLIEQKGSALASCRQFSGHKFEKRKKWPGDGPELTVSSQELEAGVGLEPDPVHSASSRVQADSDGGLNRA